MSIENVLTKIGQNLDKIVFSIRRRANETYTLVKRLVHRDYISSIAPHHRILILDSFLSFLSFFISIHLRIGMDLLDYSLFYILKHMLVFSLVSASVFLWFKTHLPFWKYMTIDDMYPIFLAVIIANVLFFPLMMLMNSSDFLPYSILVINVFVLCFCLIIPRCICRTVNLYNEKLNSPRAPKKPKALLAGDLQSVANFYQSISASGAEAFSFEPGGILLLEKADTGRTISGIPVIGRISDITAIIRNRQSTEDAIESVIMIGDEMQDDATKFIKKVVSKYGIKITSARLQYEITEPE